MVGLFIVGLIVLHMLAVAFLYQRVPSADHTYSLRASHGIVDTLKKSRDSLSQQAKNQWDHQKPHAGFGRGRVRPQTKRDRENLKDSPHHASDSGDKKHEKSLEQEKDDTLNEDKQEEKLDAAKDEVNADAVVDKDKAKVIDEEKAAVPEVEEKGDRVTDKAYIGDFVFQREHPHFRTQEIVFPELDSRVESLESCGYVSGHRLLTHAACRQKETLLTAFNSLPFPRYWCGKLIAPNAVERFDQPCHQPVTLFPITKDAPVSGEGMPPVVITANTNSTNLEEVSCDIPCKQQVGMEGITRYIQGTNWKITTTAKDPSTVREAKIDDNAHRNDEYYSTSSFSSSVPLSPFSFDDYNFSVAAVEFNDTLPSASYLIDSECSSQGSKRHRWVGAVEKHFPVAYYGSCTHNTDLPEGMSLENKDDRVQLHRKHRFNLAFESSNEKDYMTEVIFDAFQSGSLPVILGPSNIQDHFPPKSFINAGSFQYWDELGQYIKEVAENKTLWKSYHEWRKDPDALKSFRERFSFTKTTPECRMCRWAYAKQYGLGWDHVQQVVQETALPRELCVDSELVTKPFVESYATKSGENYEEVATGAHDSTSCQTDSTSLHAAFDFSGLQVERSIESHDGVTDLVIKHVSRPNSNGDFIIRLEFGVKNVDGASFRHPHTLVSTIHGPLCSSVAIQDERSRVTVLANWETEIVSSKEGTIEIVIHSDSEGTLQEDETRRIRVIMEDSNPNGIHDKLTEYYPSSFGKQMIHDFVDPLELFYNTN